VTKIKEFQLLTAKLERMTLRQRRLLADCLHKIGHIQAVNTLIENRILVTPLCLKCGHNKIARWGSASGLQRYRCCACRATFNTLSGTPLARPRSDRE